MNGKLLGAAGQGKTVLAACSCETYYWKRPDLYKRPKKAMFLLFFHDFSVIFPYIWPLAGPNIAKKGGFVTKTGEGWSTNPFWDFWLLDQTRILVVLACFAHVLRVFWSKGGCASSRLDHGLKVKLFQNLPKPFPKLFPIAANLFPQYLAPLGAKYMEKRPKKSWKNEGKIAFWGLLYRKSYIGGLQELLCGTTGVPFGCHRTSI